MSLALFRLQRFAALALPLVLATPLSTSADVPAASRAARAPSREAVLAEMNAYRQERGLPPLAFDARLGAAAQDRLRDMFEQGYFDHTAPDGTSPFAAVRRRGYRYAAVAENLAAGQRDAREVVEQWMRSRGHRANILGDYEDAGIAIAAGSPTGRTRGYTFVALYGRGRRV
jgi:uncharacterized protein YkwD